MKKTYFLVAGLLGPAALLTAQAPGPATPPVTVGATAAATASLYAQQAIDMTGNFEATFDGFEARLKQPEATAGRWGLPGLCVLLSTRFFPLG